MIRHILQIVWNRRRANGLLLVEMMVSFLVLTAVALMAVHFLDHYRQPLGFEHEDVWRVMALSVEGAVPDSVEQVRLALTDLAEVIAVGNVDWCGMPFGSVTCSEDAEHDGRRIDSIKGGLSDEAGETLRFEVVKGRWFEASDEALAWQPAVINERLRTKLFAEEDPLGKTVGHDGDQEIRVVGVISDYRKEGEFGLIEPVILHRIPAAKGRTNFLVRVQPGTPERFEEVALKQLQARTKGWRFDVAPLSRWRNSDINERLMMVSLAGVVCAFLLLMVGLGLVGVLGQNVTQRTKELGLRRAMGATMGAIRTQVLGELLVLTTMAVVLGTAILLQAPLFELVDAMSVRVYAGALAVSLWVMYSLVVLCGLYPSWLAARVRPAEALHHE